MTSSPHRGATLRRSLVAAARVSALGSLAVPAGLAAQVAPRAADAAQTVVTDQTDDAEIVVTGQRQRGAVIGDIPPDIQIGPAEIRSYGANSLAELLDAISPQTASGRGRGGDAPVTLLNGRRISGFAEIRDIPPEAIIRVDILPEEVALKYGYRADQKVVNIVLRPRFRALTAEIEGRTSTDGGRDNPNVEASLLKIDKSGRFNLAGEYTHNDGLLDSQRNIVESASRRPYDLAGNVVAPFGSGSSEIDPALSALAGQPVTVAGVPASAASAAPGLGAFTPTANRANTTNLAPYRNLLPNTESASVNAVLNRGLGKVNATVNGRFQYDDSASRLGLASAALAVPAGSPFSPFTRAVEVDRYLGDAGVLRQDTRTTAAHLGLTLDGDIARWRWSLTSVFDRTDTRTLTDRGIDTSAFQARLSARDPSANPFGPLLPAVLGPRLTDRADSLSTSGGANLMVSGSPFDLPAGAVSTSARVGYNALGFDSSSVRSGVAQSGTVTRDTANGQFNIDLPLTSRRQGFGAAVGDLSVNANVAVDHLSDFGTLVVYGYGAHWTPIAPISLVVSATQEDGAPSVQQLGNPQVATPQVQVFDYRSGQTVEVTRLDGGNRALIADHRSVVKAGLTLKPFEKRDITLTATYVRSETKNAISAFPGSTASPEIEAAFPDRFVRDASGRLTQIDARPVNFARETRQELRWGINFSKSFKSKAQDQFAAARAAAQAAQAARPPGAAADARGPGGGPGGGRGPGGGGGGRGFGGGGNRVQFEIYHTWHFQDDVLIRPGVPLLDRLDGSATGSRGGQPRHEIEAQGGVTRDGLGARASFKFQTGTTVDGTAGTPNSGLEFGSLATLNLRLFANPGQLPGFGAKHPWLRGSRVLFAVDNVFNARQRVTDATGAVPINYQPDRLDPLGRTVRISFRKLFF